LSSYQSVYAGHYFSGQFTTVVNIAIGASYRFIAFPPGCVHNVDNIVRYD